MSDTALADLELPTVDTNSVSYLEDPHGTWKAIRERHWLARTEWGVNVLSYQANHDLVRCRQLHAVGDAPLAMQGITDGILYRYWTESLLFSMESEQHDRLRKLETHAFTPRMVDRLRPAMRSVTMDLLAPFAGEGRCEFAAQFAGRYPVEIIARVLGIPSEDITRFERWSTDLGLLLSFPVQPVKERVESAISGLFEYVHEFVARRRTEPGDDLITELLNVEADGDRIRPDELPGQVANLILGGHDTTRNQLSYLLMAFCEHPDQWRRLAEEPSLAALAVEEGLRLHPILPFTMRLVAEEFAYDGVRFPARTLLILRSDCANRDPAVFTEPETFDITRENAARQVTFGGGSHYCLGAYLARAELQEALPILARTMPGVRLDGPGVWRPYSSMILGPETMPVAFDVVSSTRETTNMSTDGITPALDYSMPGSPPSRESFIAVPDVSVEGALRQSVKPFVSEDAKAYRDPHELSATPSPPS